MNTQHLSNLPDQEPQKQIDNPAWHIHRGEPHEDAHLTYKYSFEPR